MGGRWLLMVISVFLIASIATAEPNPPQGELVTPEERHKWTGFRPYIPERVDYAFELGAMWEKQNLYWLGAQVGFHMGRCVLSKSESCQQYLDFFGGAGGRDGQTNLLALAGWRWQFITFPKPFSPSVRVFAGAVDYHDDQRDYDMFTYGIGYGWTASVHERVDLSLEVRAGQADRVWSQVFFGVHLKMDRWLSYFAERLQGLGGDAARSTVDFFSDKDKKKKPQGESPEVPKEQDKKP
jgi:hypothetical protein